VKLTDTQLLLLSAASQRDDRALEPSPKLTGGAAGKVVAKLLTEGLVEEVRARGSLPVWRRDDEGPRALHASPDPEHVECTCPRLTRTLSENQLLSPSRSPRSQVSAIGSRHGRKASCSRINRSKGATSILRPA